MDIATAESLLAAVSSPCTHLETCIEWADDSGKRWIGDAIERDPVKLAAMNAANPRANTLQLRIERALALCRRLKRPARIIVLKGRRSGSSLICSKVVDLECRNKVTKALVMADVFKRSDEIFELQRQFATSDVFPWGFGVSGSARKIEYGNGSEAIKETALDPNAGRGGGFRVLWFSECAHFPSDGVRDANKLMLATLNTVPKTADSIVIAESTANGQAGWFYTRWLAARWPEDEDYWKKWESEEGAADPDEIWMRVFAAWYEIPRNSMELGEGEEDRIMASLTPAEAEGIRRYQWTPEQLKWRRWTIRNDFNGNEAKCDQEYPPDPKTAFVASGSPAFSRESLAALRRSAEAALGQWKYGVLDAHGAGVEDVLAGKMNDVPIAFRAAPLEEAWLAVLEMPAQDARYLTSCDPATGADVTDGEGDLDNSSVLVLRAGDDTVLPDGKVMHRRPRVVARIMWQVLEHHPTERVFLYVLAMLCRWYGNCTLVVETNKGEWVVVGAKRAGLNLYRQQILTRVTDKVTEQLGFSQTEETRHAIITRLQSLVHGMEVERDDGKKEWVPGMEIEDMHIVEELETFVRDKRGRFAAAHGRHDDDVLALAMGAYLIDGAARYRTRKRRRAG